MTLFLHKTKFCRFAFLRLPSRSKKIYVCGFVGSSDCRFARVLSMVFIWSFSELPNAFFLPARVHRLFAATRFFAGFRLSVILFFLSRHSFFPAFSRNGKLPPKRRFWKVRNFSVRQIKNRGFCRGRVFVFNFSVSSQSRLCNRKQLQSAKPSFYPCVFPESPGKETLSRRLSRRPSLPPESDPICLGFPLPSGPAFVTILYSMRQR